ncbi:MAG: chloride channel protein [Deltaproteobacteria bacterium]|nr:chloride channel protein [Deltaproteobacteria bacterium]
MKKRVKEETIIFLGVVKWIVLAAIVGIITGLSTTLYIKALNAAIGIKGYSDYYFLLLPLGLLVGAILIKYLAPEEKTSGANLAIEAVNRHSGRIRFILVPIEFIGTILTIAFGGSGGKEGPSVQIGAGLAAFFTGLLGLDDHDRKKLVVCGMCGGFASVFGAPMTGALYGVEVLAIGSIMYDVLLPAFVTSIVSYHVSSHFGITYFYHPIKIVPAFSNMFFLKVLAAGVFFGVCSFAYIEGLHLAKKLCAKIKFLMIIKSLIAGSVLVVLALVFSTRPLGLGLDVMESAIEGGAVSWYDPILKIIHTGITLGFGGLGGKVTPMVFVGATSGSVFGSFMGVDPSMFAAIGFVSLLAGASNTPIAASVMAVELFGAEVASYAAIACVVSFMITGHRSVYPSQILAIKKSSSFKMELGRELEGTSPEYVYREKSLIGVLSRLLKAVKGR